MGRDPSIFVHPTALCESRRVGARTRIWAFAHVMEGAEVGEDCKIGDHAFIESGARIGDRVTIKNGVAVWDKVTLEDDVFVGPNAVFTNDLYPRAAFPNPPDTFLRTRVERGVTVGANATLVCGVTVRSQALVGAGSVVVHDVPAHAVVVGNPARRVGWVCACGERLPDTLACHCGRRHRLLDEVRGLAPLE